jgi:hypothetical protein
MRRLAIGASTALALVSGGAALAHDASRPSHIHAGACPAPGDVIAPLSDAEAIAGDAVGSTAAIPVETGSSMVELALSDILAADHAIVVHHGPDDMGTYLVCGDLGGVTAEVQQGTRLLVGLAPVGDSTFSGLGVLRDNGDGTTTVNVFITDSSMMMMDDA